MEEEFREQSEFNMAIYTLGRLNYSLYLCSEHMRNMDLSAWFFEQINLYSEVSTEMKGDMISMLSNGKEKDKKIHKKDELIKMENYIKELEPLVEQYNNNRIKTVMLKKELFTKLRYMNMFLRKIMKASGLLLKMKGDAGSAL